MITITKCTPKLLKDFRLDPLAPGYQEGLLRSLKEVLLKRKKAHTFALVVDGTVVAVGGLVMLWDGVAEIWLGVGDVEWAKKHTRKFVGICTQMVDSTAKAAGLRRLQCTTVADSKMSCRFVEALGFISEGQMPGYGVDGSNHVRYAKLYGS